ncbi:IclR family transcriptional regulator [Kribbella caucasensis]|uniref:IclR family transcriptional regulator n=1 Tax=Kribbella caucasensis TaxID=2512215 RepID=UPI001414F0A0|nr:IclR family transcriptional regulator [Kribbella sp. VKM Ac-2527]
MRNIPEAQTFGDGPKYPLESVDNALRLLAIFSHEERIRVKDVAELLGVSTGTAHRLLAMLVYRGYVAQDTVSKLYVPGVVLLSIGLRTVQHSGLRQAAAKYLDELGATLSETIHLATLQGAQVFYLDGREPTQALRVASRAGTLRPAHCTSAGKALLAELTREEVLEIYPDEHLLQVTDRSIRSRSQLLIDLGDTRRRGYAANFGELEDGIGSVAVAVRSKGGRPLASLAVGAPMTRISDDRIVEMVEAIGAAAKSLGEELSGTTVR